LADRLKLVGIQVEVLNTAVQKLSPPARPRGLARIGQILLKFGPVTFAAIAAIK
jgi:hypothetical protein